jgi:transcriptional regulator with XRE-family HTH domain
MRRHLKISQEALGEALKMTFQQIQKYERGTNRVSASKLYRIAERFGVDISYFFDGLPSTAAVEGSGAAAQVDTTIKDVTRALTENPALIRIVKLPRRERVALAGLIDSMADTASNEPEMVEA